CARALRVLLARLQRHALPGVRPVLAGHGTADVLVRPGVPEVDERAVGDLHEVLRAAVDAGRPRARPVVEPLDPALELGLCHAVEVPRLGRPARLVVAAHGAPGALAARDALDVVDARADAHGAEHVGDQARLLVAAAARVVGVVEHPPAEV